MAVYGLKAEAPARFIIGIDEVGRGALAGPVVVAAAMMPRGLRFDEKLKDSKKLSARQRELWYARFMEHPKISFAVARVYPRQIEKRNISGAANLAASRAYGKLILKENKLLKNHETFLDGGLYLGNKRWQATNIQNIRTVIKADEKIIAVMVASIIAKVHRDRFMVKLAKQYPKYGFEVHKGYGTRVHRAMVAQHGSCSIHRLTFIKKAATI